MPTEVRPGEARLERCGVLRAAAALVTRLTCPGYRHVRREEL